MRTNTIVALFVGLLALPLSASAQSAKATAQVNELVNLTVSPGPVDLTDAQEVADLDWSTILEQTIKVANNKDLFVTVSLECGLLTRTRVQTQGGATDTEWADAGVRVRVVYSDDDGATWYTALPDSGRLLDGAGAFGGGTAVGSGVSFCRRFQQLQAKLQGILDCPAGVAIPAGCTLTDEEIELLLSTLDAHAFTFLIADLSSGTYIVKVEAVGIVDDSGNDASSAAVAGAGSVTIEEVRMVRGEDITF